MPATHTLRVPALRRKANGNHFVRFYVPGPDGKSRPKDHSLGTDPAIAQVRYKAALKQWADGRDAPPTPDQPSEPTLRIAELARMMLDSYAAQGRAGAERGFRNHLTRFLRIHGTAELRDLTTTDPARGRFAPPIIRILEAFAEDLSRPTAGTTPGGKGGPYAPRTINHDMAVVKRLFNWGAERGFCPRIAWQGLSRVKVPRSEPEDITPAQVRAMLAHARSGRPGATTENGADAPRIPGDPRLVPYLALQYLCLLRPTEAIRLVLWKRAQAGRVSAPSTRPRRHRSDSTHPTGNAIGRFLPVKDQHGKVLHPRGLFELYIHKNAWRRVEETDGRYIVLTDEALHWFDLAEPIWSHPSNLTRGTTAATGRPPHVLRDSGASHLRALGAAEEDVDILLGHCRPGELLTYARVPWHTLRASAARLTLTQAGGRPRRS